MYADSSGVEASIARLYMAVFTRQPDSQGHQFWVSQSAAGMPLAAIADEFVRSPEFVETYATLDNHAFVELLYRNVMDRAGDREGVAYWTGRLDGGTSRAAVTLFFSESPEFKRLTGTG